MNQASPNSRITATLITIAGISAWAVALTLSGILKPTDLFAGVRYLGIATVVASAVLLCLNRYFWRTSLGRALLGIPNVAGRWEGWSYRSYTREWRPVAVEINQYALDITVNAWGPDNWVRGMCAAIVQDRLGGPYELVWTYSTVPVTPNYHAGDAHSGTFFLRLSEAEGKKHFTGRYVTDRLLDDGKMGAGGFIRLIWVSSVCNSELAFDESRWPMSKPSEHAT